MKTEIKVIGKTFKEEIVLGTIVLPSRGPGNRTFPKFAPVNEDETVFMSAFKFVDFDTYAAVFEANTEDGDVEYFFFKSDDIDYKNKKDVILRMNNKAQKDFDLYVDRY